VKGYASALAESASLGYNSPNRSFTQPMGLPTVLIPSPRLYPWGLLATVPLTLLGGAVAAASTLELNVLPRDSLPAACPPVVIAHETARPYFEGGYTIDGMVKLRDIATDIRLVGSDDFSATWVATLKPDYAECHGSAGISVLDGEPYGGHSYLRLQFAAGQVTAILDMTGWSDANGFTAVILYQGLREGNPRWTWGGTD
jgi:hypothetical protein